MSIIDLDAERRRRRDPRPDISDDEFLLLEINLIGQQTRISILPYGAALREAGDEIKALKNVFARNQIGIEGQRLPLSVIDAWSPALVLALANSIQISVLRLIREGTQSPCG